MLNVALIGAGAHSSGNHGPSLRKYAEEHPGRVRLAAVCDLNPERAQAARTQFGFARAVTSIGDLFAEPIDALVAVLPLAAMREVTVPLFSRGVPMLIEKPLGRNLQETEALVQAAEQAGMAERVMVSLNRRYDPAITRALAWLRAQPPFRYVRASMLRNGRGEPDFIWSTGIHVIDALQHIAGPLTLRNPGVICPGGGDQSRIALLRGQADVVLEILPRAGEWQETFLIVGDRYQVEVHTGMLPPWRVRAVKDMTLEIDDTAPADAPGFVCNGSDAETAAFLDALVDGRPLPPAILGNALASSRLAAQIAETT